MTEVEKAAFSEGDVVELKGGGEPMTVAAIKGADVHCVWWNYDRCEPSEAEFFAGVLRLANA